MSKPDVLAVAKLHPFFRQALDKFYTVHDRTHLLDPGAFDALAPRIIAVAASGESSVPRGLIEQLPAARIVSVFGVGYDGIDAAAALARPTGDGTRDLPTHTIESVRRAFPELDLDARKQDNLAAMGRIFGEELPSGLVFHE